MITTFPPLGAPPDEMNSAPIDSWTAVHVATGFASGAIGLPPVAAIGLAVLYEIVEYAHEYPSGSRFFGSKRPESGINVAIDLVVFTAGMFAGRALRC